MERQKYTLLFLLIWTSSLLIGQSDASSVLDSFSKAMNQAKGISAGFEMKLAQKGDDQRISFVGNIRMKGSQFQIQTSDYTLWFDGKTQWFYLATSQEVNISEPSAHEIQAMNPLLLVNNHRIAFKSRLLADQTLAGIACFAVELTPQQKSELKNIQLLIDKSNYLPKLIKLNLFSGGFTQIKITQLKTGMNYPDQQFVFDPKSYPQAEIIDLR